MATHVIENITWNDVNMSRVSIEQKLPNNCQNNTSLACDRSAQGISLSTPIIMMSLGVLGNVLALIVLYSSRREAHARRTVFFVMLAGLAWTDLIGQFAVSPIAIITYANNLTWVGGIHLCRYHGFMMVSFGIVTPLIVCAMSVERFLAIKFSYYYARHVTRRKAQLTFLACWCVTLLFTALPFVGFGSYELQFPNSWCFLNFHRESNVDTVYAAMFSSLNIIGIVIMITCNLIVAGTLFRLRLSRHLHSSPSVDRRLSISGVGSTTSGTVIRPKRHSDMEAQMIWFLGLITIAFSVCWLPLNVHILIMQFTGTNNTTLDLMFIRMVSCNQILDPWLYVIFRKNSLLRIIRQVKACFRPHQAPPPNGPVQPPHLRYALGNRSFTCEATTIGRTVVAGRRRASSPTACKHFVKKCDLEIKLHGCDGDSLDSVTRLMPVCNGEVSSPQITSNPGLSPPVLHQNHISYGSCKDVLKCPADQVEDLQQKTETKKQGTSEPLLDMIIKSKKIHKKLLENLDISVTNDINDDFYYSLDSQHHPSMNYLNKPFLHRNGIAHNPNTEETVS